MASPVSHALVAVALGTVFPAPRRGGRYWLAACCSILPDIDVIGFHAGVAYDSLLGHRGLTHSIAFAAMIAAILTFLPVADRSKWGPRWISWLYLFLAGASHGILDALTNGGLGVAFFSPVHNTRYFLPWQPVEAGPLYLADVFSPLGKAVAMTEFTWIVIPSVVFMMTVRVLRLFRRIPTSRDSSD